MEAAALLAESLQLPIDMHSIHLEVYIADTVASRIHFFSCQVLAAVGHLQTGHGKRMASCITQTIFQA
jgi:hypothetical protein